MINDVKTRVYSDIGGKDFPFRLITATVAVANAKIPPIERRDHDCCIIEYVDSGAGFLDINGQHFAPQADSVYIVHKHSSHKYWPDPENPWRKIFFNIDGELMQYLFKIYRLDQTYYVPDCRQLRKYFTDIMRLRNYDEGVQHQAAIIFHTLLDEISALVHGVDMLVPDDVAGLKKFLDNSIERKVCLDEFCRKHGRSTAHMIRQFKKHFEVTPYDYLMRKRTEAARLMLRHTQLRIKEIAAILQFSDQYHFSNYFRKQTGVFPLAYRTSVRNLRMT